MPAHTHQPTPSKDEINLLDPFERLDLDRIRLVSSAKEAEKACAELAAVPWLGFDTESKPTFRVGRTVRRAAHRAAGHARAGLGFPAP